MIITRLQTTLVALTAAAMLTALGAQAQTAAGAAWPSKPIHWIVPFPPGGQTDLVSRLLGPKLAERIGQPVIIENRPGAAGNIAVAAVAKAEPDGHTVLFVVPGLVLNQFLYKSSTDWRDLASVIQLSKGSWVLIARNGFAPKTMAEVVAAIKANPGAVSCGISGFLACELLRFYAQAKMIIVNYKGQGPALNALMGGEIDLLFDGASTAMAVVKAGRARLIASLDPKRGSGVLADVPTVSETIPGFELVSWHGVMAPTGTPREIIQRLNREIAAVLAQPDIRQRHTELGLEIVGSSSEAFEDLLRRESAMYGTAVKKAGIKPRE